MSSQVRLVRRPATETVVPTLDPAQQAVVDHAGGPLLVLAGPGTGKTTTLVEAIVDRIDGRGADPASVLALTFSRKAAENLRDRVTARLGRTIATPLSMTFHSFAHALVRRFTPSELYAAPLRLLSAPQADVLVKELLEIHRDELVWPESLGEAVHTRGFTGEVAAVISRARERGADHVDLITLGRENPDSPEFLAAGLFLEHYLNSLDDHGATDHPDLIRRAVIEATAHSHVLRRELQHVFVDEYQDTDPGQVELLRAIAGGGADLVAVGDPNQSIYGFRGAEVRGILDFPSVFRTRAGEPSPVAVLDTTRRFGPAVLAATARVAANLPLTGSIPEGARARFAQPRVVPGGDPGRVEVFTFDSERAEAERVADLLRRAHLDDGVAWSDMAVLVRSGRSTLPVLRRLLTGAGVPVEVAADEIPLAQEPAVEPLLLALEIISRAEQDPDWRPTPEQAEKLLLSPLGGLGATGVRSLGRALRQRELVEAIDAQRRAATSQELLAGCLVEPDALDGLETDALPGVTALRSLLDAAREALRAGEDVESLLWRFWSGTGWGQRLRAAVLRGGASAQRAHRDLDALCALFEVASRTEQQRGRTSARTFLDAVGAQQIPGDTLAEKGVRGDTVRLLTAHRSKGLEWRLVVVAHVQEGNWPDLRRRATLLGADRLGSTRYGDLTLVDDLSRSAMLAEERRLFYVASTRARERLVVTAVSSLHEDGEVASRFLDELCPTPDEVKAGAVPVRVVHQQGRPRRPLTLDGVVADLRRTTADPDVPEALRDAAARRLAALSAEEVDGRPLVPGADPRRWWGTAGATANKTPVREVEAPVRLSASTVQSVAECPARWFLEREAGGASFSGQGAAFGNVVHKIAEHVVRPEMATASLDDLMELVDAVWDRLPFRTPWSREHERVEARSAIERFLNHHHANSRTVVGTEVPFSFVSTLPDGSQVHLRGFADRLEIDAQGRVVVVDLKTGKYPPSDKSLVENPQLGIYQYAVERGGFEEVLPPGSLSGGAELWQLRASTKDVPKIQAQARQDVDEEGWLLAERQLAQAVRVIRDEAFAAVPGKHCDFCAFQALCPAVTTPGVIS